MKHRHLLKTDLLIVPYLKKQIIKHTVLIKKLRTQIPEKPDLGPVIRSLKQERRTWIERYENVKAYKKRNKTRPLI